MVVVEVTKIGEAVLVTELVTVIGNGVTVDAAVLLSSVEGPLWHV